MTYMYTDGKFHSTQKNNASTMMQAFNYGTAAFEGMRAYYRRDEDNWFLFRPDRHFARLLRSATALGIDLHMTCDEFVSVISALIRKNHERTDLYIRPLVFRNAKGVGLTKASGYGFSVFTQPMSPAPPRVLRCCFVPQRRPIDGSYTVKLAGNYVLSFLSHSEAERKRYDAGILLSNDGYVSESSVMNLFFVRDGKLFTPSLQCGALDGITRQSIIELSQKVLRIKVAEGKYRPARLLDADEVFLCGTGSGINYVGQIERRRFSLKQRDSLAPKLRALYGDAIAGKIPIFLDWLVPVRPAR